MSVLNVMSDFNCRAELYRLENDATMAIVNYSQVTMIKHTTIPSVFSLLVEQSTRSGIKKNFHDSFFHDFVLHFKGNGITRKLPCSFIPLARL